MRRAFVDHQAATPQLGRVSTVPGGPGREPGSLAAAR